MNFASAIANVLSWRTGLTVAQGETRTAPAIVGPGILVPTRNHALFT
jgi:hypothetical protein